ncbi:MAG: 3-hydroxyacyl-CoA dehydrogenase family protein [Nocardioidaceae bacterium]
MTARKLTVAVLGAGTMGVGIALVAARAGHRTIVRDVSDDAVKRGLDNATGFLDKGASLGKLTTEEARAARDNLTGSTDLVDVAPADVVVEAVFEELALKQRLLGELDDVVSEDALLHTNTSTLSVTAIAAGSRRPERVVGTHYCNPAQLMRLVEVAEGRHTAPEVTTRSREFLEGVGKTTVLTKDRPGFIVNRFLIPWENNCIRALEAGHGTVESIDRAVVGALRHPMGPFQLLDVVGLDVHQAVSMRLYEQLHQPRFAPPPLVDRMVAAGDLGRKTGRGFYTYDNRRSFGA